LLVTMNATQGADLVDLLATGTAIPIHNDDYGVFTSPLTDFSAEVNRRGLLDSITCVEPGQTITLARRHEGEGM
jgi:L-ascorbate metabolism protein UlaG (beta-lactamase superfamily)